MKHLIERLNAKFGDSLFAAAFVLGTAAWLFFLDLLAHMWWTNL